MVNNDNRRWKNSIYHPTLGGTNENISIVEFRPIDYKYRYKMWEK